jgi:hypothetical protein
MLLDGINPPLPFWDNVQLCPGNPVGRFPESQGWIGGLDARISPQNT